MVVAVSGSILSNTVRQQKHGSEITSDTTSKSHTMMQPCIVIVTLMYYLTVASAKPIYSHNEMFHDQERDQLARCLLGAPRTFTEAQRAQLCAQGTKLDDAPAQCAITALGGSSHRTLSKEYIEDVIKLCSGAQDIGPAICWSSLPIPLLRTPAWSNQLIQLCRHASDVGPSRCFMELKRQSGSVNFVVGSGNQLTTSALTAIQVCKDFQGDDDQAQTISQCIRQSPRSLEESARFLLCRNSGTETTSSIIDCAKHLLQRNLPTELVIEVCAHASTTIQPQECALRAYRQLKWMDTHAISTLCHGVNTIAPVKCATSLHDRFVTDNHHCGVNTKSDSFYELARLCREARTDQQIITDCVRLLPVYIFSPHQIFQLCGMAPSSIYPAECVIEAKRHLFGLSAEESTEEQAAMLVRLCEGARSSAPVECLSAVSASALSAIDRTKLCEHTTTSAPQECFLAIRRSILKLITTHGAVELCTYRLTDYPLGPAQCANALELTASTTFISRFGVQLCMNATNEAPAHCFHDAPPNYSDPDKVTLCQKASGNGPATCARESVPQLMHNALRAQLCAQAESVVPAQCATQVPHGMSAHDIILLCNQSIDITPALCARMIPSTPRIAWRSVAEVCNNARTTTPGSCLAYNVRQRRLQVSKRVIADCRKTIARPTSLDIQKFAYECPELIPKCIVHVTVRLIDQFGEDMPSHTSGYVQLSAGSDDVPDSNILAGSTITPISNGSAHFRSISFIKPGLFTLYFRSPGIEEAIAKVQINTNATEEALRLRCDQLLMDFMKCPTIQDKGEFQILVLSHHQTFAAVTCEMWWSAEHSGITLLSTTRYGRIYTIHRLSYQLLIGHNHPTSDMSPWECLGIPEGSNRSTIRRAYHQRSLEWHPDKWISKNTMSLRGRMEEVYALVNQAYQLLSS